MTANMDGDVLLNIIMCAGGALYLELTGAEGDATSFELLKWALFFWVFGTIVGIPFGKSWFVSESGNRVHDTLGSLLYTPAIFFSFAAVLRAFRELVGRR